MYKRKGGGFTAFCVCSKLAALSGVYGSLFI